MRLAARRHEIIITKRGKPAARLSAILSGGEQSPTATLADRRRLRADYRAALAAGKLSFSEDSTPSLRETAALRDL